jgi:hypothetical protein
MRMKVNCGTRLVDAVNLPGNFRKASGLLLSETLAFMAVVAGGMSDLLATGQYR